MAALTVPPQNRPRLPARLLLLRLMVCGSFFLLMLAVQVQGGAEGRVTLSLSASVAARAAQLSAGLHPHRLVVDHSFKEAKGTEFSPLLSSSPHHQRRFLRTHPHSSRHKNRRRLDELPNAPVSGSSDGTVAGTVRDALIILGSIVLMIGVLVTAMYVQIRYCKYYGWGASARQIMAAASEARARRQREQSSSDPVLSGMTAEERLNVLRHLLPASKHPDAPNDDDDDDEEKEATKIGESPTSQDLEDDFGSSSCFFYGQQRVGDLDATRVDGSPSTPVQSSHPDDGGTGDNHGGRHFQAGCSICLSKYHTQTLLLQTSCGHIFHYECCLEWLSSRSGGNRSNQGKHGGDYGCPYCRTTLVTPGQLRIAAEQLLGPDRIEQLLLAAGQSRKASTTDDDNDEDATTNVAGGSTSSTPVPAVSDAPEAGEVASGRSQDC